jgi:hypothetical protein
MASYENRSEGRIRSRGRVTLLVDGVDQIPGTIRDVSISGISLETKSGIACNTVVLIDGPGFVGEGIVRYCEPFGPVFRVGVQLRPANADAG